MGLTGLEIYKLLPKKNCGECGPPTCLAFAMQLAANKGTLDACPYVTDEAKEKLGAASQPPIRLVTVGAGDHKVGIGDETVLFRHDKTFFHETGIAIEVPDNLKGEELAARVDEINKLTWERVGLIMRINLVAVRNASGDADRFAEAAKAVASGTQFPLVLITENSQAMEKAAQAVGSGKPLLWGATSANWEKMAEIAKAYGCPLVVSAPGLDALAELVEKVAAVHKDLVLDPQPATAKEALFDMSQIRRQGIKKKFRHFGYPTIASVREGDALEIATDASMLIAKYASIVVLPSSEPAAILPLVTLRQNIYTDPQKPIQVEPGVYAVGEPNESSPVLVTTNFSLTYFTVMGDIEASKVPAYMLICDTDGTSVLTAWAAGKFSAESIAEAIEKFKLGDKVSHRKVILPGYVAVLSGKLGQLSNWEILVGSRESAGIPAYLKSKWSA